MNITELVQEAHGTAKEKGWWENDRSIPEIIALIHSEASEALECYRNCEPQFHTTDDGKPEGIAAEFADIVIRVADACGAKGIDLDHAIQKKLAYNKTRPHRHGGKRA